MQLRVWVAVFALLVQALLPSFVHAVAPKNSYLAEICTAFGVKKIGAPDSGSTDAAFQGQQCPICSVADALVLPLALPALHVPSFFGFDCSLPSGPQHIPETRLAVYLRGPPSPV